MYTKIFGNDFKIQILQSDLLLKYTSVQFVKKTTVKAIFFYALMRPCTFHYLLCDGILKREMHIEMQHYETKLRVLLRVPFFTRIRWSTMFDMCLFCSKFCTLNVQVYTPTEYLYSLDCAKVPFSRNIHIGFGAAVKYK